MLSITNLSNDPSTYTYLLKNLFIRVITHVKLGKTQNNNIFLNIPTTLLQHSFVQLITGVQLTKLNEPEKKSGFYK